jgi:hypothetical protein
LGTPLTVKTSSPRLSWIEKAELFENVTSTADYAALWISAFRRRHVQQNFQVSSAYEGESHVFATRVQRVSQTDKQDVGRGDVNDH